MNRSIGFLDKRRQENLVPPSDSSTYPSEVDIKKWIRAAREQKGATQPELGEAVGVSKQNVSAWENGHHEPSFGQMVQISHFTSVPMPAAGYKPRKAYSPYATAVAELIDRQAEEDRKSCATVAKTAIEQHLKDQRKARTATPAHRKPTPSPLKK